MRRFAPRVSERLANTKRTLIAIGALALMALAWTATGGSAATHGHARATNTPQEELAPLLASARLATAKYATSLRRAKRNGYTTIVTQHMPDMGWHFMNPEITEFDVTRPPILVYVKRGGRWQLVAFEWVFSEAAGERSASGCAVRLLSRRLPLRRRHVRTRRVRVRLPAPESRERRAVRVLAPRFRDPPPLGLVPEPRRHLCQHQPADPPVQRRLNGGPARTSPSTHRLA